MRTPLRLATSLELEAPVSPAPLETRITRLLLASFDTAEESLECLVEAFKRVLQEMGVDGFVLGTYGAHALELPLLHPL